MQNNSATTLEDIILTALTPRPNQPRHVTYDPRCSLVREKQVISRTIFPGIQRKTLLPLAPPAASLAFDPIVAVRRREEKAQNGTNATQNGEDGERVDGNEVGKLCQAVSSCCENSCRASRQLTFLLQYPTPTEPRVECWVLE